MLAQAVVGIGLEWNPLPCPKGSWLDDWYMGSEHDSQPRPAQVPFFPEVHDELMKSWKARFTGMIERSLYGAIVLNFRKAEYVCVTVRSHQTRMKS